MSTILDVLLSWQFLLMGVIVALLVMAFMALGNALWKLKWKWLRGVLRFLDAMAPWIPWLFGIGLGLIPVWPRPGALQDLPADQGYAAMVILGLLAGGSYERIWKFVKQTIEARGIELDLDLPPKAQKKASGR